MAEVNMPRLSDTMQEGTITRWLKKPGDQVKKGDVVAEVETDKANMEVEAYDNGILEQILVQEGETVPIGQVIALIGDGSGAKKATAPAAASAPAAQAPAPVKQTTAASNSAAASPPQVSSVAAERNGAGTGAVKSSPLARRMAEEHGIDLSQVKGSGPGGRIVRDDIEDLLDQRTTAPAPVAQATAIPAPVAAAPVAVESDDEVINLSSMQKTIARRLTESKQSVPHFYISNEIDMTEALAMRIKLNAGLADEGVKISVNDLVIKACAKALEKFPEVNGAYRDGQFILHKRVNIGVAVDVPAGLLVPVLRDVNTKSLSTIAREAKAIIAKAQSGKIAPADLDGGTFSISNLGMMDVTQFVAVINPPQAAILAVAATKKTFVPDSNGQPVLRDIMHVTLSADHRILYGATVARFLKEVKRQLENVYLLIS